jgi:hypothetical protein
MFDLMIIDNIETICTYFDLLVMVIIYDDDLIMSTILCHVFLFYP